MAEKAEGWSNWSDQSKPKKAAVTHIDPHPYVDRWLPLALEGTGDSLKCILGRKSCRQTDRKTHTHLPTCSIKTTLTPFKPQFRCTYLRWNPSLLRLPPLSPLASPGLIYPSSPAAVTLEFLDWVFSCECACFALCASIHACMYGCLYPKGRVAKHLIYKRKLQNMAPQES